jgi:hypothetical protein
MRNMMIRVITIMSLLTISACSKKDDSETSTTIMLPNGGLITIDTPKIQTPTPTPTPAPSYYLDQ